MHRLFERQLRKATFQGNIDIARLGEMVSAAYDEADAQRRLNSNALAALQSDLDAAAQRVREDAEARFNAVMDNVGEAVVVINDRGHIESFNTAAERIFGYESHEVLGMPAAVLVAETGVMERVGIGRETVARRRNGEEFPAELALGDVCIGPKHCFIGIIRDITQRKLTERELRESESRFRDLAGSASDWFWETDGQYRLTFVSERIANVLGVKPAAILGHSFFEIGLGDGAVELAAAHASDIAARRPFRDVVFHVGPEGGTDARIIRISGIPVFDPEAGFIGYRGVGCDITREIAAEKRARMAQQQLADAIESLVDAIAVYDADDRLVVFNSQYKRVFDTVDCPINLGMSFESLILEGLEKGLFEIGTLTREEWLRKRMKQHRTASGEPFVIQIGDGRWFLSRESRTRDGGVVGVRTDITEIKQRESELDALRHRYELILGAAGEGIIGLSGKGRITFANEMAGKMLGHTPDQMIGCCFHALVQLERADGQPYPTAQSAVRQAYLHGATRQVRNDLFWRGDGSNFRVEYQATPIMENGWVAGAVLVFRDATLRLRYEQGLADQQRELERLVSERTGELQREVEVRTRTEQALRASRERLKSIADSLFEGVLVIDRSGQLAFANASARRLLACDAIQGDIEGHFLDDLMRLRLNGEDVGFADSPWRQVVTEGVTLRDDNAMFVAPSGVTTAVAYACSPVREDETLRAAIISFRDIGELKQAQREALQASRLASVGQLAAGIAHEINTPVQYIGDNLRFIGTAQAKLASVLEAAEGSRFDDVAAAMKLPYLLREIPVAIEESLDGVAQIARIVLSMKEFSHPGTSNKATTDLNRAIESTLTVSRNSWKHVAELHKDLDPELPPVLCYAGEMNQVFLNLIINAAHAIEDSGKPLPGIIAIRTARIGDFVEIMVRDNGTGVPNAIKERIFDPFFTTKDVGKGTGQGLAICRDVVVSKHGGWIDVGDSDSGGAIFTIRLPIGEKISGEGGAAE